MKKLLAIALAMLSVSVCVANATTIPPNLDLHSWQTPIYTNSSSSTFAADGSRNGALTPDGFVIVFSVRGRSAQFIS